jgi:hypothetical protein
MHLGSGWEAATSNRPSRLDRRPAAGLPARRAAPAVRVGHLPGARRHVRTGHAYQVGDPDPGHGRHRRPGPTGSPATTGRKPGYLIRNQIPCRELEAITAPTAGIYR